MYFSCFHQGQKTQMLLPHFLWEQLTFYFVSRNLRKIISVREARISSRLYNFLVYYFFHQLPFIHFSSRYCHLSVLLFSESLSAWSASSAIRLRVLRPFKRQQQVTEEVISASQVHYPACKQVENRNRRPLSQRAKCSLSISARG